MLLMYLAYRIYGDLKLETQGDDSQETFAFVFQLLGFLFFWPVLVISLGEYLESQRHKNYLTLATLLFAVLVLILAAPLYPVIGLLCLGVRTAAYDYYAGMYMKKKNKENAETN